MIDGNYNLYFKKTLKTEEYKQAESEKNNNEVVIDENLKENKDSKFPFESNNAASMTVFATEDKETETHSATNKDNVAINKDSENLEGLF